MLSSNILIKEVLINYLYPERLAAIKVEPWYLPTSNILISKWEYSQQEYGKNNQLSIPHTILLEL